MRRFTLISLVAALTANQAVAVPTRYITPAERGLDDPGVLDNVLLFDAPAFLDPANPANTIAEIQAYVSLRTPNLGLATGPITSVLSSLGIEVGDKLSTLQDRVKLIASVGLPGKKVQVTVAGCSQTGVLPSTSITDLGLSSAGVSLGTCSGDRELQATMVPGALDSRKVSASIFPSANSGFGVISDIDDTVKISNVLDTGALLKSTFLDDPKAVSGMPALYKSLSQKLNGPQFIYITGSPYQLYPFLNNFLDTAYPDAKGPIFTKNLTIANIPEAIKFFTSNDAETLEYKVATIDRLHTMYPGKKWLAIGDSTQKDPEAYATAFKKYPGFISCIWIRQVDGADNSDARFGAAFAGVTAGKFRAFKDADIATLANIDVAGGNC